MNFFSTFITRKHSCIAVYGNPSARRTSFARSCAAGVMYHSQRRGQLQYPCVYIDAKIRSHRSIRRTLNPHHEWSRIIILDNFDFSVRGDSYRQYGIESMVYTGYHFDQVLIVCTDTPLSDGVWHGMDLRVVCYPCMLDCTFGKEDSGLVPFVDVRDHTTTFVDFVDYEERITSLNARKSLLCFLHGCLPLRSSFLSKLAAKYAFAGVRRSIIEFSGTLQLIKELDYIRELYKRVRI